MIVTINTKEDGEIGEICAKLCLSVAAQFAEENGLVILGERDETGKVVYWFERRKSHDHK